MKTLQNKTSPESALCAPVVVKKGVKYRHRAPRVQVVPDVRPVVGSAFVVGREGERRKKKEARTTAISSSFTDAERDGSRFCFFPPR